MKTEALTAEQESTQQAGTRKRYAIYKGSQSRHCCFEATVVDTTKPDIVGGEHYKDSGPNGQYHYEIVCECLSEEAAELVCKALNALDSPMVTMAITANMGAKAGMDLARKAAGTG